MQAIGLGAVVRVALWLLTAVLALALLGLALVLLQFILIGVIGGALASQIGKGSGKAVAVATGCAEVSAGGRRHVLAPNEPGLCVIEHAQSAPPGPVARCRYRDGHDDSVRCDEALRHFWGATE